MASEVKLVSSKVKELINDSVQKSYRDGIELEKGTVITEEWLIRHEDFFRKTMDFFSAYPDLFEKAA